MEKSRDTGLLLIRLGFGIIMAMHGWGKVADFPNFAHKNGGTVLAACAVAGEFGGGLGLAVGFLTRIAGLGLAAVMWYIAFHIQHAHISQVGTGGGSAFEYPFLIGVVGLAFFFTGAGAYSLDARVFGPPRER
jgi:putative oxidoreductase